MDYSERMLRAEIAKIPDGEYSAPTGWLDDDARNRGVRLRVETKVVVEGDSITIDLTGSNPEVPTGFNVPFEGSLLVGAYYAVRTILLDEAVFPEHVPQNDGVFRPVEVVAPKGTIYNPTFPARVLLALHAGAAGGRQRHPRPERRPTGADDGGELGGHSLLRVLGLRREARRVLALPRGERRRVRRPPRQGRDGLRRQPDGQHAQQPDRGARPALPDPLRPVRAPARAGRAGQVARRHRHHPAQPLPRSRRVLLRGRPADRPAARRVRRLGRARRLLPEERRPAGRGVPATRRSPASPSRPATSSSSSSRTPPGTATRSSATPSSSARTSSTTSRRRRWPATPTESSSPTRRTLGRRRGGHGAAARGAARLARAARGA